MKRGTGVLNKSIRNIYLVFINFKMNSGVDEGRLKLLMLFKSVSAILLGT